MENIFKLTKKAVDKNSQSDLEAEKTRKQREEKIRREREIEKEDERREREKYYEQQRAEQAKAVAEKVLITVGEHQVGDEINGKKITGFGKQWSEKAVTKSSYGKNGERWDENCSSCGKFSDTVDNNTGECSECYTHDSFKTVNYHYTYFA